MKPNVRLAFASMALLCCSTSFAQGSDSDSAKSKQTQKTQKPAAGKPQLDRSGDTQKGKASYYAKSFSGKKMADGTPMNPNADIAASRTLPLGTRAEVINLENGKSREVEIRDRGPYVDGRIVDLSPKVARDLDMHKDGVADVLVKPIEVPQADGSTKPGSGAATAPGTMVGSSGARGSTVSARD
jgi:rare lipoprotein A